MCGIIGYKGEREASQVLLDGLRKLEYRGYDSVGIAVLNENQLIVKKDIGKVEEVNKKLNFLKVEGHTGISHSRWATHGGVTDLNAHPHLSCDNKIAVAHNGIIENFEELKQELRDKGHQFKSQTDTEVIPHLIEEFCKTKPYEESVKLTLNKLKGSFAVVILNVDSNLLIGARHCSPLVLGVGENEFFLSSDVTGFLKYTNKAVYLDEDEMAIIRDKPEVINFTNNQPITKTISTISWSSDEAEKQGYEHFMLKEIHEQRGTIKKALNQDPTKLNKFIREINNSFGLFFIACGTAYHACLTGSYIFSKIAKKHVNVILASEFPNYEHFLTDKTLIIPISQSGETADVLEAIKVAKKKGSKVLSIVNVMGSSLTRLSDDFLLTNAGPEIAVASTKAFTSQLTVLTLLAYGCNGQLELGRQELLKDSLAINEMVDDLYFNNQIKNLSRKLKDKKDLFIIGRDVYYPIALEAALKIKEVSYVHAEGFAGGELKHGTLALIEKDVPCLVYGDHNIIGNAQEIKARGGFIIGVAEKKNPVYDLFIKLPRESPIVNVIPAQLIAYFLAKEKGCDIDKCRNLAKSVTVK